MLVGDSSYHGCRAACSHVYLLFGSFSIRFRMKSFAVGKEDQGEESECGLREDRMVGPSDYQGHHEKHETRPPGTTGTWGKKAGGTSIWGKGKPRLGFPSGDPVNEEATRPGTPPSQLQVPSRWQLAAHLVQQREEISLSPGASHTAPGCPRELFC